MKRKTKKRIRKAIKHFGTDIHWVTPAEILAGNVTKLATVTVTAAPVAHVVDIAGNVTKLATVTVTAAPVAHVVDMLDVTIEIRPPRPGELGYWVVASGTPEEMLAEVVRGRSDSADAGFGFGFAVESDYYTLPENEVDSEGCRCVTVKVTRVMESTATFSPLSQDDLARLQGVGKVNLGKPGEPDGRHRRHIDRIRRNAGRM